MHANVALVTPWFTINDKDGLLRILSKGDLLEFKREAYRHWAVCICVGTDPVVAHRTTGAKDGSGGGFCSVSSSSPKHSVIRMFTAIVDKVKGSPSNIDDDIGAIVADVLWDVLSEYRVRINNSRDKGRRPKIVADIVGTALESMDGGSDVIGCYHLLKNNCEHFANYCRYGEPISDQARDVVVRGGLSLAIATGMILLKLLLRLR